MTGMGERKIERQERDREIDRETVRALYCDSIILRQI